MQTADRVAHLTLAERLLDENHVTQFDGLDALLHTCTQAAASLGAMEEALHRAAWFIEALHENNPDTTIADNGMTVLDGLKNEAPGILESTRAALATLKETNDGDR